MLTEPMLRNIHALLPADDARGYALRRLVRILARNGGSMGWAEAIGTFGSELSPSLIEARTWDGVRLSGCGLGATLALAPWVRRAVGLEVSADELLAHTGQDDDEPSAYHHPAGVEPRGGTTSGRMNFVRIEADDCEHATPEELARSTALRRARLEQAARQAGYDSGPCPRCHERRTVSSGDAHACEGCGHRWTEGPAPDPLAEVRAAVARAENVATVSAAIAHAGVRFRPGPRAPLLPRDCMPSTLPRDCPGGAVAGGDWFGIE